MTRWTKTEPTEHQIQSALFEWAHHPSTLYKYPQLEMLYSIPNGGIRDWNTAKKLKKEGGKRGVPDICLPVPNYSYHSLYLETKTITNKPTPDQFEYIRLLKRYGNWADVYYNWEYGKDLITRYLENQL